MPKPPATHAAPDGTDPVRARRKPGRPPTHGVAAADLCTAETILRAARDLFMLRGYAGVAVGELAAAAGVTKPTVYYHFGDKEGLYAAVIGAMLQEVGGYIREVTEQAEPVEERLIKLAFGYFIHADYTMEPMLRDVAQLVSAERSAQIRTVYERECIAPIERMMADGLARRTIRAPLDSRLLAQAFLALLEAFTGSGGHAGRTPSEHAEVARVVVALFWRGAAGEERTGAQADEHTSGVLSS